MPDSSGLPGARASSAAACPEGRLHLSFRRGADGTTQLDRQFASYPFHVCRPFRIAGDPDGMATLYIQSCSGGIYGGDRLSMRIEVAPGASAHVTTQAACIAYGMRQSGAVQETTIEVGADSFCEFLPDPVILFPRTRLETSLTLCVGAGARVVASESFLLHDPLGQGRPFAALASLLQVVDAADGRLLVRDRLAIGGEAWTGRTPGVTGNAAGLATVVILGGEMSALAGRLRATLDRLAGVWAGVSRLPSGNGVSCRILARDGRAMRGGLAAAWRESRRHWTGNDPEPRRK